MSTAHAAQRLRLINANRYAVKYLSNATSTFILKIKREHYRLIWAALTSMDAVPVKSGQGKACVFKVVRVSGTIRKAEEEAIRQARKLVLAARSAQSGPRSGAVSLLTAPAAGSTAVSRDTSDADMLDIDNASEDDGEASDNS